MNDRSILEALNTRLKNTPSAFEKYTCLHTFPVDLMNIEPNSLAFKTQLVCNCGNPQFQLKTAQTKELRGVCVKTTFTQIAPPIYTICSQCNKTKLLFDPVIHGWKGELELVPEKDFALNLCKFKESSGQVYVRCTYRKAQMFKTLVEKDISDLENYFDSIHLFYSDSKGENISEIYAHKCFS